MSNITGPESLFREIQNAQEGLCFHIEDFKRLSVPEVAAMKQALAEGRVFSTVVGKPDFNNKLLGTTGAYGSDGTETMPLCYLQVRVGKDGRQKNELIFCEGNDRVAEALINDTSVKVGIIGVIDKVQDTFTYWGGKPFHQPKPILGFNAVYRKTRTNVTNCASFGQSAMSC